MSGLSLAAKVIVLIQIHLEFFVQLLLTSFQGCWSVSYEI